MTCETCRFAKAFPMPEGERPELPEPPKPKGFWAEFFSGPEIGHSQYYWASLRQAAWDRADRRSRNEVKCQRFPTERDKLKTDWCGEYDHLKETR